MPNGENNPAMAKRRCKPNVCGQMGYSRIDIENQVHDNGLDQIYNYQMLDFVIIS